jgi:DNA-binding cell septation regulator SpoVG
MVSPQVRIVKWTPGTPDDLRLGLIAYVRISLDRVLIDVTARRTAGGKPTLSYPERRDGKGRRHSVVRPINDEARRAIEAAVFREACAICDVEP